MVRPTTRERELLLAEARTWLGTPFAHQQRVKGAGVDCAGLVLEVAKSQGFFSEDHERRDYSRYPVVGRFLQSQCEKVGILISRDEVLPGSVFLFWVVNRKRPQHLAYMGDNGKIIHAWSEPGMVVETSFGPYWEKRIVQCYDLKKEAPNG